MARSLKVLGLALASAAALGAVVAPSALGTNAHHFTTGVEPAYGTVKQEKGVTNVFKTTNNAGEKVSEISCQEVTYEGTIPEKTSTQITVTPTYPKLTTEGKQNCTAFGLNAEILTNHCAYKVTGQTDANGDAAVELKCASESAIEIKVPSIGCTLKVGAQTEAELEKGVHFTDTENPATKKQSITTEGTVTSIAYTTAGFCPSTGNGTSAHLETKVTAEAFIHEGSNLSGTELTTPIFKEGAVTDLTLNTNVT